ncbi:MAG: grasp-with-spasm system SPASM domain peptide maturase, partial [Saprospirales bacterium]
MTLYLANNCVLSEGHRHAVLIDLQRHLIFRLPGDLFHHFKSTTSISSETSLYGDFKEIIDYLHELAILVKYNLLPVDNHTGIDDFFSQYHLIIYFPLDLTEDWVTNIKTLPIEAIQIRFPKNYTGDYCKNISYLLNELPAYFIEVFIDYGDNTDELIKSIMECIISYNALGVIRIFNAPFEKFIDEGLISFHRTSMSVETCGIIEQELFVPNLRFYSYSKKFNSCLYGKISIDAQGNIKNCPSMKESYGNIRDTTLAEALEKPGFKKYWDINKDKIHVCKDCEFRYICTDCRA